MYNIHHILRWMLFLSLSCFSICLFWRQIPYTKTVLYSLSILCVISGLFATKNRLLYHSFNSQALLWGPLLGSFIVFMVIHGVSGLSQYLHFIAISFLLHFALTNFHINRLWIIRIFSINVLVISTFVVFYILQNGLATYIAGVNKNLLVPEIALVCSVITCFFCSNFSRLDLFDKTFFALTILVNVIAVVLSEVRTAILVYFSIFPVLLLSNRSALTKSLPWLILLTVIVVLSFFLTGRFQEGINDLLLYRENNANSSWGIRLELWKTAISAFPEHPIIGWGRKPIVSIIAAGYPFAVPSFLTNHFHNDFFNILAGGGIVLTAGWLTTIFLMTKSSISDPSRLALVFGSLAIGLTERFWAANIPGLFIFMICWLLLTLSSFSEEQPPTGHLIGDK